MNLIIDQGNSKCKVALYRGNKQEEFIDLPSTLGEHLELVSCMIAKSQQAIYSSVATIDTSIIDTLHNMVPKLIVLDEYTALPLQVEYDRLGLGADRIAAAVGAFSLSPGRELLIIDAGTAITYERVSSDAHYLGGNIAPGMEMRFKSLHHFTGRLPYVEHDLQLNSIGNNSQTAIHSGVIRGMIFEIDGYIDELLHIFPDAEAYITGGNAHFFASKLRNSPIVRGDLVLLGLNKILEYNDK